MIMIMGMGMGMIMGIVMALSPNTRRLKTQWSKSHF